MSYRLILPSEVENQIYDCALYIARDNPERAISWVDEVMQTMRDLCETPHAFPAIAQTKAGFEIRKRPFGAYLIFYRVDEEEKAVVIQRFRHGSRAQNSG